MQRFFFAFGSSLLVMACSSQTPSEATSEPDQTPVESFEIVASFPDSLVVIGDGYPVSGNLCRRLGESAATADWLDTSAILVGCPTESSAVGLGGEIVGRVERITIVSVPTRDENAGMNENAPISPAAPLAAKDFIRGKGGVEDKCKVAVAKQGATVIGTNRIEESEAAVEIYVNVEGGVAPWRCLGYRDGTIGAAEFMGDEGAL